MSTTKTLSTLTLDGTLRFPAQSLLSLATQVVRSLHMHYTQIHQAALASGDEDAECDAVENLGDVELSLQELDPVYWIGLFKERHDFWSATELARRAEPQARMSALLELSSISKVTYVVPEAVKLWRESREAGADVTKENEDAQLDLLIFLSEDKPARAGLFKFVTADDRD